METEQQKNTTNNDFQQETIDLETLTKIQSIVNSLSPQNMSDNMVYGLDSSWKISSSLDYDNFCNKNEKEIKELINNYKNDIVQALTQLAKTSDGVDSITKEKICYLLLKCSETKDFQNIKIKDTEIQKDIPLKLLAIKLLAINDKTPDCYSFELLIEKLKTVSDSQNKQDVYKLVIDKFLRINEPSERLYEVLFNSIKERSIFNFNSTSKESLEAEFVKKLAKYYNVKDTDNRDTNENIKSLIDAVINIDEIKKSTNYNDFTKLINEKYSFISFIKQYEKQKTIRNAIDKLLEFSKKEDNRNSIKSLTFLKIYIAENSIDNNNKQRSKDIYDALNIYKEYLDIRGIDLINFISEKAQKIISEKDKNTIIDDLIQKNLEKDNPLDCNILGRIIEILETQHPDKNKCDNLKKVIDYIQNKYEENISDFLNSTSSLKEIKTKLYQLNTSSLSKYIANQDGIKWGVLDPHLLQEIMYQHGFPQELFVEDISKKIITYMKGTTESSQSEADLCYIIDILEGDKHSIFPSVLKLWGKTLRDKYDIDKINTPFLTGLEKDIYEKIEKEIAGLPEINFGGLFEAQTHIFEHCQKSEFIDSDSKNSLLTKIIELQSFFVKKFYENDIVNQEKYLKKIFIKASEGNISLSSASNSLYRSLNTLVGNIVKTIVINKKDEKDDIARDNNSNDAENIEKLHDFIRLNKLLLVDDQKTFLKTLSDKYNGNDDYRDTICEILFNNNKSISFEDTASLYDQEFTFEPSKFAKKILDRFDNKKIDHDFSIKFWDYLRFKSSSFSSYDKSYLIRESILKSEKPVEGLLTFIQKGINENSSENTMKELVAILGEKDLNGTTLLEKEYLLKAINTLLLKNKLHLTTFCYMLGKEILKNKSSSIQKRNLNQIADSCIILLIREGKSFSDLCIKIMREKLNDDTSRSNQLLMRWAASVLIDVDRNNKSIQQLDSFYKKFLTLLGNKAFTVNNLEVFVDIINNIKKNNITNNNLVSIINFVNERLFRITQQLALTHEEQIKIKKKIQGVNE